MHLASFTKKLCMKSEHTIITAIFLSSRIHNAENSESMSQNTRYTRALTGEATVTQRVGAPFRVRKQISSLHNIRWLPIHHFVSVLAHHRTYLLESVGYGAEAVFRNLSFSSIVYIYFFYQSLFLSDNCEM